MNGATTTLPGSRVNTTVPSVGGAPNVTAPPGNVNGVNTVSPGQTMTPGIVPPGQVSPWHPSAGVLNQRQLQQQQGANGAGVGTGAGMGANNNGLGQNNTRFGTNLPAVDNRLGAMSNRFNVNSNLYPTSRTNGMNRVLENQSTVNRPGIDRPITGQPENPTGGAVGGGMTQPLPGNNP